MLEAIIIALLMIVRGENSRLRSTCVGSSILRPCRELESHADQQRNTQAFHNFDCLRVRFICFPHCLDPASHAYFFNVTTATAKPCKCTLSGESISVAGGPNAVT